MNQAPMMWADRKRAGFCCRYVRRGVDGQASQVGRVFWRVAGTDMAVGLSTKKRAPRAYFGRR